MSTSTETEVFDVANTVATVAVAAAPVVALALSPTAAAVVALVAAVLKNEPALATTIKSVIADFEGTTPATSVPLNFAADSATVEAALHGKV